MVILLIYGVNLAKDSVILLFIIGINLINIIIVVINAVILLFNIANEVLICDNPVKINKKAAK